MRRRGGQGTDAARAPRGCPSPGGWQQRGDLVPGQHRPRALALARLTLELGLRSEGMYPGWLLDAIEHVHGLPREEGN